MKKIKFLQTIDDLNDIQGGISVNSTNGYGCICMCRCFEETVMGLQVGMISPVSSGELENPPCTTALSSLWE